MFGRSTSACRWTMARVKRSYSFESTLFYFINKSVTEREREREREREFACTRNHDETPEPRNQVSNVMTVFTWCSAALIVPSSVAIESGERRRIINNTGCTPRLTCSGDPEENGWEGGSKQESKGVRERERELAGTCGPARYCLVTLPPGCHRSTSACRWRFSPCFYRVVAFWCIPAPSPPSLLHQIAFPLPPPSPTMKATRM